MIRVIDCRKTVVVQMAPERFCKLPEKLEFLLLDEGHLCRETAGTLEYSLPKSFRRKLKGLVALANRGVQ